jgi:hypothetical protein
VRSGRELDSLPARSKQSRQGALAVIAKARNGNLSIAQAIRAVRADGHRVSRESVVKYAGPAIERGRGRRLMPTANDRIYRRVPFLTEQGVQLVDVRSSRRATLVAGYRNAVGAYLTGKDPNGEHVLRFAGRSVGGQRFETDLDVIDRWAARRELDELNTEGS